MSSALALAEVVYAAFDADELDLLREDALEAIPIVTPEITLRIVDQDPGEDSCGIEGHYDEASRTVVVRRATSRRRTWVTTLHELGHDRARGHPEVASASAQLALDAGRRDGEGMANASALPACGGTPRRRPPGASDPACSSLLRARACALPRRQPAAYQTVSSVFRCRSHERMRGGGATLPGS